jgi:hypothetical protein
MTKRKSTKGKTTIVGLLSKHIVSQNISFRILIEIASWKLDVKLVSSLII